MNPGHQASGKYHNCFAKATLDELGERGSVRANLKFELVLDTNEILEHAWLFETGSEGVLCREPVPGSCILYIRDTEKNVILWTRPDPNAEEEEEITIDARIIPGASPSPEFVIPDASEDEGVEVEVEGEEEPPAPLSGSQDPAEDVDVEVDEAPDSATADLACPNLKGQTSAPPGGQERLPIDRGEV